MLKNQKQILNLLLSRDLLKNLILMSFPDEDWITATGLLANLLNKIKP